MSDWGSYQAFAPRPSSSDQFQEHVTFEVTRLTELRLAVPEAGKRLLPLPVAAWHATVGRRALKGIAEGGEVLGHGQLVRRFYRG
jgi:hypothetical protein